MDQHLNMEALERAGAGVLLRTERLNTEGVAAAVKQVLSGAEFRQAARRLAEAFGPDFAGFRSTSKVRCGSSAKGCPRYRRLANGCPVEHLIRERVAVQNAEVPQRLS